MAGQFDVVIERDEEGIYEAMAEIREASALCRETQGLAPAPWGFSGMQWVTIALSRGPRGKSWSMPSNV